MKTDISRLVSIRCRRHKKRINVEESWTETSKWLCPHCYNKLTEEERERYAPKKWDGAEIREAVENCSSNYRKLDKIINDEEIFGKYGASEIEDSDKVYEEQSVPEEKNEEKIDFEKKTARNPLLDSLLPKHKVFCQKCEKFHPCHESWFKTSRVLCPICVSKMTDDEVRKFNLIHQYNEHYTLDAINKRRNIHKIFENTESDDIDFVYSSRAYANKSIMEMTKKRLLDCVKLGRISKVRAKIELNRRKKSRFYNILPDRHGITFGRI